MISQTGGDPATAAGRVGNKDGVLLELVVNVEAVVHDDAQ
jgi:hypothetical protein